MTFILCHKTDVRKMVTECCERKYFVSYQAVSM